MKSVKAIFTICMLSLFINSCCRESQYDIYFGDRRIPISADWSISGLNPQNVTVLFYDELGTLVLKHIYENNSNPIQSYVDLPQGIYTVVLFNEIPDQADNTEIENINDFFQLTCKGITPAKVSLPISGDTYVSTPGEFASVIVDNFKVTEEMVIYSDKESWQKIEKKIISGELTDYGLLNLKPLERICNFIVKLHVDNLCNARMPVLVNLRNMSGSYILSTDKDGTTPVTYQFTMNNRIFDSGSNLNGSVSTSTRVFGVMGTRDSITAQPADKPILLDMRFMLNDKAGTIVYREIDITHSIEFEKNEQGSYNLIVDLSMDTPLPPIDDGSDAGFNSDLINWNIVYVPIVIK